MGAESGAALQWYPGHMTKTRRMLAGQMGLVDVVVELLDARIPVSSRNPDIEALAKGKKRVLVLNKADLADKDATALWEDFFRSKGFFALSLDATGAGVAGKLAAALAAATREKRERQKARGRVGGSVRAMVVGIPNVGKSTFINSLAGRAGAKASDRPGVTRGRQWLKADGFDLLDTPGILWPKFGSRAVGLNLAATGAISDLVFDKEAVAGHLLETLCETAPALVQKRYFKEAPAPAAPTLESIGEARGFKLKGGKTDLLRAAIVLLDEFRGGKLGRITLETPPPPA